MTLRSTCSKYTRRQQFGSFKCTDYFRLLIFFVPQSNVHPEPSPSHRINRWRNISPRISFVLVLLSIFFVIPPLEKRHDAFERNVTSYCRVVEPRTSGIIIKERRKSLNGRRIVGKGRGQSRRCERELVAKLYLETQVDTRWGSTADKPES